MDGCVKLLIYQSTERLRVCMQVVRKSLICSVTVLSLRIR